MHIAAIDNEIKPTDVPALNRPRLGYFGIGLIGRHHLQALLRAGVAEIVAVADPSERALRLTRQMVPEAAQLRSFAQLLDEDLDGLVIATPTIPDPSYTIQALQNGFAVFSQKPLGRTSAETEQVIQAARDANRLIGVDLSYRHINGVNEMRQLIRQGDLGNVFVVDLIYHSAYGPDKNGFFDAEKAGGGCLLDLGTHLVDLALWSLDYPKIDDVFSRFYRSGNRLQPASGTVEDYVVAQLDLSNGATLQLTCSWNAPAGCDAVIEATFFGSKGAATLRNRNGSFYGFTVERYYGTARQTIDQTFDDWDWAACAALQWAEKLALNPGYDTGIERVLDVASALDAIYSNANGLSERQA